MTVSVIVPATDSPPTLSRCLEAIRAAAEPPDELFVVDGPAFDGPASARNRGARHASGDVLMFIDSDVEVHPDVFARVRARFAADDQLAALFGSYDAEPAERDPVSTFRNLLHHHIHQQSGGPANTFWTGLGAVRAEVFHAIGGLDAERYTRPSIEDIELGSRLAAVGAQIELDPGLLGKHLKRWTLTGMVATDLLSRGAPWVALLLRRRESPRPLNLGWRHRLSALASLTAICAAVTRRTRTLAAAILALAALNRSFYGLLARRGRWPAALLSGLALHALHHITAVAAVPIGAALSVVGRHSSIAREPDSALADPGRCRVCGATLPVRPALSGPDRLHGAPGRFCVAVCDVCGAGTTRPELEPEEMRAHYPGDYGPHAGEPSLPGALGRWHTRRAARGPVLSTLLAAPPGCALDVGCGAGDLGAALIDAGWRVTGIDPSPDACARARERGVDAVCGTLADLPPRAVAYDAVVFQHSLEHLEDPLEELASAAEALRPDGVVLIALPNFGGWQRRLFRSYWFGLDLPRHRSHFTPESLALALERCGYAVEQLRTVTSNVALPGSLQYVAFGRCVAVRGARRRVGLMACTAMRPLARMIDRLGGSGDVLFAVARTAKIAAHGA